MNVIQRFEELVKVHKLTALIEYQDEKTVSGTFIKCGDLVHKMLRELLKEYCDIGYSMGGFEIYHLFFIKESKNKKSMLYKDTTAYNKLYLKFENEECYFTIGQPKSAY